MCFVQKSMTAAWPRFVLPTRCVDTSLTRPLVVSALRVGPVSSVRVRTGVLMPRVSMVRQQKYCYRAKFSISLLLYSKRITCMKFCLSVFHKINVKPPSLICLTCQLSFYIFLKLNVDLGGNGHYHYLPSVKQNVFVTGIKPMTFSGNSFAKWTLMDEFTIEKRLSLSMRIKTHRSTASLMFATGDVDYSILEVSSLSSLWRKLCDGVSSCTVNWYCKHQPL